MPRPRFDKLEPRKQQRILRAAADEFGEHGYRQASLNRILAAAGISKGAFYYYFDDKADLFVSVLHWMDGELIGDLHGLLEGLTAETYWPRIEELAAELMRVAQEHPWVVGVGKALYGMAPEDLEAPTMAAYLTERKGILDTLVLHGQEMGVLRTDLPPGLAAHIAIGIGTAVDRWTFDHWDELDPTELHALFESTFDVMRGALGAREEDDG